jgi:predicted small secreted protein
MLKNANNQITTHARAPVDQVLQPDNNPKSSTSMKTSLKRFAVLILAVGFMALAGTGCQTSKGFGRDVEHVGEKIQGN